MNSFTFLFRLFDHFLQKIFWSFHSMLPVLPETIPVDVFVFVVDKQQFESISNSYSSFNYFLKFSYLSSIHFIITGFRWWKSISIYIPMCKTTWSTNRNCFRNSHTEKKAIAGFLLARKGKLTIYNRVFSLLFSLMVVGC